MAKVKRTLKNRVTGWPMVKLKGSERGTATAREMRSDSGWDLG